MPLSPAANLVLALSALQSQLLKKIERHLSAHGISFSEFVVLYHLQAAPQQTLRRIDLAESVGLTASGITRLLNPMEKLKLVQKEVNPRDARVSLVKLSETGARVFAEASVSFDASAQLLLEPLSPQQIGQFLDFVQILKA